MSDHLLSYQTPRQPPCQPWAGAGAIRRRADSGLKCGPKLRARCPGASSVTRMLYHGNTRLVTLMVCVLAVLGPAICTGAARAQLADEPPSLIETVRAYELIEPWVREMDVPEDAAGPDVVGACVTLRYEGRVIGIGTIFGGGTRSLPDATRIAIASARDIFPSVRSLSQISSLAPPISSRGSRMARRVSSSQEIASIVAATGTPISIQRPKPRS